MIEAKTEAKTEAEPRAADGQQVAARRILIVDDEPLARQRLRRYLTEADGEFVVAEAETGVEAVELITRFAPEVIFLDIEMPGFTGFDVLAQFGERRFQVVFQTAYDEFAVRAFEEHACDYLLKPFTRERFEQALARVLSRVAHEARLTALEAEFARRDGYLQRLTVKQGGKLRVVEAREISCFVSRDHYTCVYFGDAREAICDLPLAHLIERLDPQQFRQLHRNNIARIAAIVSLTLSRADGMTVEVNNGLRLPVSRSNRRLARRIIREQGNQDEEVKR